MSEYSSDQKNEAFFLQLVLTFQTAAWQQMGKLKNPLTDQIEKDLNQVQFSIDMLEMIRTKTQGNLSENEKLFLNKAISELQLNYVAEVEKEKREKERETATKEAKEEEPKQATEEKKEEKQERTTGEKKEKKRPRRSAKSSKAGQKKGTQKRAKKK